MTLYEIITVALSLLAIIASFSSLIQNHKLSKRQSDLEIKQTQLVSEQLSLIQEEQSEKERAKIKLAVIGSHSSFKLLVKNDGFAPAFNVTLEIVSREGKSSPLIQSDYKSKFPLKRLDPGDSVELFWAIDSSTGTDFDTICKWQNKNGKEEIKETLIS